MTTNELTYKILKNSDDVEVGIAVSNGTTIPLDPANTDYQVFLDNINEHGASIVEGDLPESIVTAAAEKKFVIQLSAYQRAVARLAQYLVSVGRPEVKEMLPVGQKTLNEETGEMEDVLVETITQTAIDPLPETVQIWEDDTQVTVPNPAIVQDETQRAAAQAIIDATPQEVKDAA
jgi:hypothetical protein